MKDVIKDFPMLNSSYVFLDNSATSFKPYCVIDAINDYYKNYCVNAARGDYKLSYAVDEKLNTVRNKIKKFINAAIDEEIVFTSGTTDGLNMVIRGYFQEHFNEEDIILTTKAEHASLILPLLDSKLKIVYIPLDHEGMIDLNEYKKLIQDEHVKAVAIAQVTNVLGYELPVKEICQLAHENNALVLVDGAQSVPHMKVDVQDLDCDFLAFSAHKMLGPTGLGVLYGKSTYLNKMKVIKLGGGNNVNYLENGEIFLKNIPYRFESGTLPLAEIFGFEKAIDYLNDIGMEEIHLYEQNLMKYLINELSKLEHIIIYNQHTDSGILTINVKGVYGQDFAHYLDINHIAIRAGQHCSRLLESYFETNSTVRISLYFYNTKEDIDYFINVCKKATKENIFKESFNNLEK